MNSFLYCNILMESIFDLFFKSVLEKTDNTEYKNIEIGLEKNPNIYDNIQTQTQQMFPSLNQGQQFHMYQDKIISNIVPKIDMVNTEEGFQNAGSRDSTKQQFMNTIQEYNNILGTIAKNTNQFVARSSPNNPFNNKILNWTDPQARGLKMYVTNKGVARPIKTKEIYDSILGKNGCPGRNKITDITLKWDPNYLIPGQTIPTSPSLLVGKDMTMGESCGFEGSNVFVNNLMNNQNVSYKGCYKDNPNDPVMQFIGGKPSSDNFIQNGNFESPVLPTNTFRSYTNSFVIPGWNVTAALLNNSSAWGYPRPYPNGNQCISLQKTGEVSATLNLQAGSSYSVSLMACGRNCCDKSGQSNPVDILLDNVKIYSFTPPVNKWTEYSTTFTGTKSGAQQMKIQGTWTASDRSTAIQGVSVTLSGISTSTDYTYEMCKQSAIDGQYKYFALQNANPSTQKGYCAVGNDIVSATSLRTAYKITSGVVLWNTNTKNINGTLAQLTNLGQLVVYNNTNAIIYETPNNTNKSESGGTFQGCFKDTSQRAMTWLDRPNYVTPDKCKELAVTNKFKYYGLQNSLARSDGSNNVNACFGSNDLKSATKYGKSTNCRNVKGLMSGGPWANAIYTAETPGANYYLILQNDGNMVIYKGLSPSENQGAIWSSKTNGKQRQPNPNYEAKKGKYGRNWMKVNETLAKGEFIGSVNGSIYLLMRQDGNLVLCTSDRVQNCQRNNQNQMVGGENANALYEFADTANPEMMNKVSYVDIDSTTYSYPATSIKLGNTYTQFNNSDSPGNDIPNAAMSATTINACKEKCNSNNNCYGFAFDKQTQTCYPKGQGMFPTGPRTILNEGTVDLYTRSRIVKNPNVVEGLATMNNIDTIRYDNYDDSNKNISDRKKVEDIVMTSSQKQQLQQVLTRLNLLGKNISNLSATDQQQINRINTEIEKNTALLAENIKETDKFDELKNTEKAYTLWKTEDRNLDNMLNDSNLKSLHENYNYILWTSLALGTLLVTLKVAN